MKFLKKVLIEQKCFFNLIEKIYEIKNKYEIEYLNFFE